MENLISHQIKTDALNVVIEKIKCRIQSENENIYISKERQLQILNELVSSKLGRFLLLNQGLNGYWTHYILTYPMRATRMQSCFESYDNIPDIEKFILEKSPGVLASQERFQIFLRENQQMVQDGALLASIPCGLLAELIYLDIPRDKQIQLIGIDLDAESLNYAQQLSKRNGLQDHVQTLQRDAWSIGISNEYDLISSSGLTIYEPDNEKKITLYEQFYKALRIGGKLVMSFLTYPSGYKNLSEWDRSKVNMYDLIIQKAVFSDIIQAKWESFNTSQEVAVQCELVGFKNVRFIYDRAKIFPTVVAEKI